jgi:hypothetical protein
MIDLGFQSQTTPLEKFGRPKLRDVGDSGNNLLD